MLSPKCKIITWISTVIPPSSLRADLLQQIQPLYDTQQLVQRPRRKQTLYKYFYFIVVVERSLLSFSWTVVDGVRDNEGAHHGLQHGATSTHTIHRFQGWTLVTEAQT